MVHIQKRAAMELFLLGGIGAITLLVGALLLVDYLERVGANMQERKAIVFEVYRYAVCFVMVTTFGLSTFQLGLGLILDSRNPQALTPPALGAIISGLIFLVHWFIKNPMPETETIQPKS